MRMHAVRMHSGSVIGSLGAAVGTVILVWQLGAALREDHSLSTVHVSGTLDVRSGSRRCGRLDGGV